MLVKPGEVTLEGKEFCGIEVFGEPIRSIDNTLGSLPVDFLEVFGGWF